jgi:putative transcriptional regulator
MPKSSKLADELPPIQNMIGIYCEEEGIPLSILAERVGISRQHLYRIESGKAIPSLATAFRIARFFKVPIEQVFACEWEQYDFHPEMYSRERQFAEIEENDRRARESFIKMGLYKEGDG